MRVLSVGRRRHKDHARAQVLHRGLPSHGPSDERSVYALPSHAARARRVLLRCAGCVASHGRGVQLHAADGMSSALCRMRQAWRAQYDARRALPSDSAVPEPSRSARRTGTRRTTLRPLDRWPYRRHTQCRPHLDLAQHAQEDVLDGFRRARAPQAVVLGLDQRPNEHEHVWHLTAVRRFMRRWSAGPAGLRVRWEE